MDATAIPLGLEVKAVYPEEDILPLGELPHSSFSPTYQTTIEILQGEKVRVFKFESKHGEITEREPTFREWKMGNKIKGALDELG